MMGKVPILALETAEKNMILWSNIGDRYRVATSTGGNSKAMLVDPKDIKGIQLSSLRKRGKMCKMFFLA